ncbi:hypothetical protein BH11PSE3_BH11PSE3_28540 [soil metagenome]
MGKLRGLIALGSLLASLVLAVPVSAQQCVGRYESMLKQMKEKAGECGKRNKLMASLTDMASLDFYAPGSPGAPRDVPGKRPGTIEVDPNFTANSKADFTAYLPPYPDGRWRYSGDSNRIVFNCTQPLDPNPMPQNEAFLECARVYVCGAAAAQCGLAVARQTGGSNCDQISASCLQVNPVPQGTVNYAPQPGGSNRAGAPPQQSPQPAPDGRQKAFNHLSDQCQQDFAALLSASQASDGAGAAAAYGRLRQHCDQALREIAAAAGVALPERVLSSRARGAMDRAFNRDPNAAVGNIGQPTEGMAYGGSGGGGGGSDVDWGQVMGLGMQLFGMGMQMAGGWSAYSPSYNSRGNTNFTTLNPRASSTYGQGAPTYTAPRTRQSDITGTK